MIFLKLISYKGSFEVFIKSERPVERVHNPVRSFQKLFPNALTKPHQHFSRFSNPPTSDKT
jgi:hypothetical protein